MCFVDCMYITLEDCGGTYIIHIYIYIFIQYIFLLIEVVLMLSPLHLEYVLISGGDSHLE